MASNDIDWLNDRQHILFYLNIWPTYLRKSVILHFFADIRKRCQITSLGGRHPSLDRRRYDHGSTRDRWDSSSSSSIGQSADIDDRSTEIWNCQGPRLAGMLWSALCKSKILNWLKSFSKGRTFISNCQQSNHTWLHMNVNQSTSFPENKFTTKYWVAADIHWGMEPLLEGG